MSQLVMRYQSGIRQLLRRLTAGDHAAADDLAQETFLTLYKSLKHFRGDASLKTWLYKIAYNHFLKYAKKSYKKNEVPFLSAPDMDYSDSDKDIIIEQLLKQLSLLERTCITLSINMGMSHSEIAELTSIPLGTVKSNIKRAKSKLAIYVKQNDDEELPR